MNRPALGAGDLPSGPLINYAALDAKGGAGASVQGGNGGAVSLYSGYADEGAAAQSAAIVSLGRIDASGGRGVTGGGAAGAIDFVSRERIDLLAPITASGGGSTGAGGAGGASSAASFRGVAAFTSSAALAWSGGSSAGAASTGGNCTSVTVVGGSVKATAPITCKGQQGRAAPAARAAPSRSAAR